MTGTHPKTNTQGTWTSQKVRWLTEALLVAAPIVFGLSGILPHYIQQQQVGLALKMALKDPMDSVIGRQIGDYLREMQTSTDPRMVGVADFNSVVRHVAPHKDASLIDRLVWGLPNAVFAMHDESKIDVFKSAIQTPAKECIVALLDPSHGGSGSDRPSSGAATRIRDLARHLEVASKVGSSATAEAQRRFAVEQNLGVCLQIGSGMQNFMRPYFKQESPMEPSDVGMIEFVRALSKTHEGISRSEQKNGIPCAPQLPSQAHNARQKLLDMKSSLIELENKITRLVPERTGEPTGISRELDATRALVEGVERDIDGILATRAPAFEISSGSMLAGFLVWVIVVAAIFLKLAGRLGRRAAPEPNHAEPPSTHTPGK